VNVALPSIGADLHASAPRCNWWSRITTKNRRYAIALITGARRDDLTGPAAACTLLGRHAVFTAASLPAPRPGQLLLILDRCGAGAAAAVSAAYFSIIQMRSTGAARPPRYPRWDRSATCGGRRLSWRPSWSSADSAPPSAVLPPSRSPFGACSRCWCPGWCRNWPTPPLARRHLPRLAPLWPCAARANRAYTAPRVPDRAASGGCGQQLRLAGLDGSVCRAAWPASRPLGLRRLLKAGVFSARLSFTWPLL